VSSSSCFLSNGDGEENVMLSNENDSTVQKGEEVIYESLGEDGEACRVCLSVSSAKEEGEGPSLHSSRSFSS